MHGNGIPRLTLTRFYDLWNDKAYLGGQQFCKDFWFTNGAAFNSHICGTNHYHTCCHHFLNQRNEQQLNVGNASQLISYTIDSWQHRNEKLHGALDIMQDKQYKKLLQNKYGSYTSNPLYCPRQMTNDIFTYHVDFV